jgi:hypothetical protein
MKARGDRVEFRRPCCGTCTRLQGGRQPKERATLVLQFTLLFQRMSVESGSAELSALIRLFFSRRFTRQRSATHHVDTPDVVKRSSHERPRMQRPRGVESRKAQLVVALCTQRSFLMLVRRSKICAAFVAPTLGHILIGAPFLSAHRRRHELGSGTRKICPRSVSSTLPGHPPRCRADLDCRDCGAQ